MLRPATPLTVLLLAAFVLLLLSVISAPIIPSIPIARVDGVSFGVFGWCMANGVCSPVQVGYTTDGIVFADGSTPHFNLPNDARHSLSSLLIVHPVAAFMCLVMLVLAVLAHWHGPSHSPRYLLALLILALPTLLITLLAFLVDILLFIPYVSWAGWLVLGSTILIVASGITLCAMRRTLVSRKARRKRIQENAEMSGENFYNRQREQEAKLAAMPAFSTESKAPLVDGEPTADNVFPSSSSHDTHTDHDDNVRSDSMRQPVSAMNGENRYYASTPYSGSALSNSPSNYGQYPPGPQNDPRAAPDAYSYPPNAFPRGRGGFVRGRGNPRNAYGPGPGRGGYRGPPPHQGHPGRGGFGPGGYASRGRGGPNGGFMMNGPMGGPAPPGIAMQSYGRRPPPEYPPSHQGPYNNTGLEQEGNYGPTSSVPRNEYGARPVQDAIYVPYSSHQQHSHDNSQPPYQDHRRSTDTDGLVRAESPPEDVPIGHAIEMNAHTGQPSVSPPAQELQRTAPSPETVPLQATYVPTQNAWNANHASSPTQATSQPARTRGSSVASSGSKYYEDVDPRFAEPVEPTPALPVSKPAIQSSLAPPPSSGFLHPAHNNSGDSLPKSDSLDDIPPGAMSPTGLSETSHYTSVSQRPVNPRWNGQPSDFNNFGPPRRPLAQQPQARQDMLLSNNPDFSVQDMGLPRPVGRSARGGSSGMHTRGGLISPSRVPLPPSAMDLGSLDSRYPDPAVMTAREI